MHATHPKPAPEQDEQILAFLRAHPGWLAAHPELYASLRPPIRVHGDGLTDHMAAMLSNARSRATQVARDADGVLAAGRASASINARVHDAALALIQTRDVIECIAADLPRLLGADAAQLCTPIAYPGARRLPAESLNALLGSRDVTTRAAPADAALLHGEAAALAQHDVLIRVPQIGLLALAFRAPLSAEPSYGNAAFAFLGRVVAALLLQ